MFKLKNILKIKKREKITHIIVTEKYSFPCYKSIEMGCSDLNGNEYVVCIMDCKYKGKRKIATINKENILFTVEGYRREVWDEISSYIYGESDENPTIVENLMYG